MRPQCSEPLSLPGTQLGGNWVGEHPSHGSHSPGYVSTRPGPPSPLHKPPGAQGARLAMRQAIQPWAPAWVWGQDPGESPCQHQSPASPIGSGAERTCKAGDGGIFFTDPCCSSETTRKVTEASQSEPVLTTDPRHSTPGAGLLPAPPGLPSVSPSVCGVLTLRGPGPGWGEAGARATLPGTSRACPTVFAETVSALKDHMSPREGQGCPPGLAGAAVLWGGQGAQDRLSRGKTPWGRVQLALLRTMHDQAGG